MQHLDPPTCITEHRPAPSPQTSSQVLSNVGSAVSLADHALAYSAPAGDPVNSASDACEGIFQGEQGKDFLGALSLAQALIDSRTRIMRSSCKRMPRRSQTSLRPLGRDRQSESSGGRSPPVVSRHLRPSSALGVVRPGGSVREGPETRTKLMLPPQRPSSMGRASRSDRASRLGRSSGTHKSHWVKAANELWQPPSPPLATMPAEVRFIEALLTTPCYRAAWDASRVVGLLHKQVDEFREDIRHAPAVWAACRKRALEIKAQDVSPPSDRNVCRAGTPIAGEFPDEHGPSFWMDDEDDEASCSGEEDAPVHDSFNDADLRNSKNSTQGSIFITSPI